MPRSSASPTRPCSRLRAKKLVGGCVTVKIRRDDFTTYTRQRHVEPRTQETRVVARIAAELLDAWRRRNRAPHCGCSASVSATWPRNVQADLFGAPESTRNRQLDATVDAVREKFGSVALRPASTIVKPRE